MNNDRFPDEFPNKFHDDQPDSAKGGGLLGRFRRAPVAGKVGVVIAGIAIGFFILRVLLG